MQIEAVPKFGRSCKKMAICYLLCQNQKLNVKTQPSKCSNAKKGKKSNVSSIKFIIGGLDKYCNRKLSACQCELIWGVYLFQVWQGHRDPCVPRTAILAVSNNHGQAKALRTDNSDFNLSNVEFTWNKRQIKEMETGKICKRKEKLLLSLNPHKFCHQSADTNRGRVRSLFFFFSIFYLFSLDTN